MPIDIEDLLSIYLHAIAVGNRAAHDYQDEINSNPDYAGHNLSAVLHMAVMSEAADADFMRSLSILCADPLWPNHFDEITNGIPDQLQQFNDGLLTNRDIARDILMASGSL